MRTVLLSLLILWVFGSPLAADELVLSPGITVVEHFATNSFSVYDLRLAVGDPSWPPVKAWLVLPSYYDPVPVVVYQHMYGSGADREEFLLEALDNTKLGWASLMLSGLVPWEKTWLGTKADPALAEAQLAAITGALSFVKAQEWADPTRLLYVGHDYGAMFGALLADRQAGFQAYALLAPSARWSDWKSYFGNSMDDAAYDAQFGANQPVQALSRAGAAPVLLQFAENDRYVNASLRTEYTKKAAPNVAIQLIPTATHEDLNEVGRAKRLEFLRAVLLAGGPLR